MPVTPFHFGPGAALHAIAPRHVSFMSFCAANVLIDVESFYNLVSGRFPVHAFFHTYVGATLVIVAILLLFAAMRRFASREWMPDLFRWRELTALQVAIGAMLGAWSHVFLDSIMHADIRPLEPFDPTNPFLDILSLGALHLLCIAAGMLGLVGIVVRDAVTSGRS